MTQYILHISSYDGIVPWARHYRGRVEGPHPEPCHGGSIHYNAPGSRGKTTCAEGHVLPEQVRWDVEADWSLERHERWAAGGFEGDGPQQFGTKREVMDRAIVQFLDGSDDPCEKVDPAQEGDELWFGYVEEGQWDDSQDTDASWGMMIARKCTS